MWLIYAPFVIFGGVTCVLLLLPFGRLWRWAQREGYCGAAMPAVLKGISPVLLGGELT